MNKKSIYLAGGCFWGVDAYFHYIDGVISTETGYANGHTEYPTYDEVCRGNTGFAETVKVEYDEDVISLDDILIYYFRIIDPTILNRQGPDCGEQYRTGIYYVDEEDREIIDLRIVRVADFYKDPIVVEVEKLINYYPAEDYHQNYLINNPSGYCHINIGVKDIPISDDEKRLVPLNEEELFERDLKYRLTDIQFAVTQHNATEPPFDNEYWDLFDDGIYYDIVDGEPLFSSEDKFQSSCGWPSFSKPISEDSVVYVEDYSIGVKRVEVRSRKSNSHLGHVFYDGPTESGGRRFCINSASLFFKKK